MSFTRPPVVPAWAATGDKASQPSDSAIGAGWPLSSVPPSRQLFNWLENFLANGLRYLMTRGVADWHTDETYASGAVVIGDDGNIYHSLQNSNQGKTPSSEPTWWGVFVDLAGIISLFSSNQSLGANGYLKIPGGLILQWGLVAASGSDSVSFPTAFTTACYNIQVSWATNGLGNAYSDWLGAYTITTTGFKLTNGVSSAGDRFWFAIGK